MKKELTYISLNIGRNKMDMNKLRHDDESAIIPAYNGVMDRVIAHHVLLVGFKSG